MHTEGEEVHVEGDEARAGSTPNIVRWVLGISLVAAILLLSAIWIFGAATTDEEDRVATASDRMEDAGDGASTDTVVSGRDEFQFEEPADTATASANEADGTPAEAPPPPE